MDTRWDIEKYRTKFESDEHWALKKDFMVAHKEKFSEERLICLAQVYVNIELMRCTYPAALMRQVSELAKDVGHSYKAKQRKRLQRTFVKASDAASAKIKGTKKFKANYGSEVSVSTSTSKSETSTIQKSSVKYPVAQKFLAAANTEDLKSKEVELSNISPRLKAIRDNVKNKNPNKKYETNSPSPFTKKKRKPVYEKIVLINRLYAPFRSYKEILNDSLQFSRLQMNYIYSNDIPYNVSCNIIAYVPQEFELGEGSGRTYDAAKENASQNALNHLLNHCLTLKILKRTSSEDVIALDTLEGNNGPNEDKSELSSTNVGARMLKLMGWTGGGLGKKGNGITEPVKATSIINRQGLGLANETKVTEPFRKAVRRLLVELRGGFGLEESDLIFTPDLSKEQRCFIHLEASKIGGKRLKTASYGKNNSRYITISRKLYPGDLIEMLMAKGGSTNKYDVCVPGSLSESDFIDK